MSKLTLLAAAGVGYVFGTRAGRERYEQIREGAQRVARNPKVRSATSKAQDTVAQQASVAADAAKAKASEAAAKVRSSDSGDQGLDSFTQSGPVT